MNPFPDPDAPDLLEQLGVVVPDDASALDAELRPVGRATRPGLGGALRDGGTGATRLRLVALLMALSVVVAIAMLAAAMTVLAPRLGQNSPGALPLASLPAGGGTGTTDATATTGGTGTTGGAGDAAAAAPGAVAARVPSLLPEGVVRRDGHDLPVRDLRPAALVVTDDVGCTGCHDAVADVAHAAREFAVPVAYVVAPGQEGDADALVRAASAQGASVVTDVDGVLRGLVAAVGDGPGVVLVHADGVVGYVGAAEDSSTLRRRMSQLAEPGVAPVTPSAEGDGSGSSDGAGASVR